MGASKTRGAAQRTPSEALAALEQAAFDGEVVSASEVAAAREAVRLEELAASGREARAAQEQAADAERARADAVAAVKANPPQPFTIPQKSIADAARAFLAAVDKHNRAMHNTRRQLDAAGVPMNDTAYSVENPEPFDPSCHVEVNSNFPGTFAVVTAAGKVGPIEARTALILAVDDALRAAGLSPSKGV